MKLNLKQNFVRIEWKQELAIMEKNANLLMDSMN